MKLNNFNDLIYSCRSSCLIRPLSHIISMQSKADEIAKLMNENEQLKSTIEDLKVGMMQ